MTGPMPDPQALQSLADRLAAATGADRELDAEISAAFGIVPGVDLYELALGYRYEFRAINSYGRVLVQALAVGTDKNGKRTEGGQASRAPHPYTASLDAALFLFEAKLPGWHPWVGSNSWVGPDMRWTGEIHPSDALRLKERDLPKDDKTSERVATAPTPALALLRAFVAALMEQSDVQS